MWAQWQEQDLAPSDEDILTFHDFLPKHFRNTRQRPFPHQSGYFWNRMLFYANPSTFRPYKISESANRNCIFLKPLSRMDFLWIRRVCWIRVDDWNRWGRGWIQTGYTTPNSSGRKYQVFSFSVSGFVFTWPKNVYMNRNRWRCSIVTIMELTQLRRQSQRERQKRNKLRLAFLYISLPSLLDYDVK